MNREFPPIFFATPKMSARRRERRGYVSPPGIPADERRAIAAKIFAQRAELDRAFSQLTAQQKRAVFLRLRHDRPLSKSDLAGTELKFLSNPGLGESLVCVPRGGLESFDERIAKFAEGDTPARPKGTELATSLQSLELGNPKDRLSDELEGKYRSWCSKDAVLYEMEVASQAQNIATANKEVTKFLAEIEAILRSDRPYGSLFETDFSERGARVVVRSSGRTFQRLVEDPVWWRRIVCFEARPKFQTFHRTLGDFNISKVNIADPEPDAETICIIDSGVSGLNPFLRNVVRHDISKSFIDGFSPTEDQFGHGSGVASLAAYYDIKFHDGAQNAPMARIASARIMSDDGQLDVDQEGSLEGVRGRQVRLLSKVLREVVTHYSREGVRVFVLSFQILGRVWSRATSVESGKFGGNRPESLAASGTLQHAAAACKSLRV